MIAPRRIAGPERLWPEESWGAIRAGCVPRDQEDRWLAYAEDDLLHLHRAGTGFEVYRGRFVHEETGLRVPELEVETAADRYQPQGDAKEATLFAELVDLLATGALVDKGPVFEVTRSSWTARPGGDALRRSAVALAEAILALGPDVTMSHRREFLLIAIRKYTEGEGKATTRFRSLDAVGARPELCNYDHVWPRKALIEEMLQAPMRCKEIMAKAIGCNVLIAERQKIAAAERADPSLEGWDRYRAAGVVVVDLLTEEQIT